MRFFTGYPDLRSFLEETEWAIGESGHTIDDVLYVGSYDGRFQLPWHVAAPILERTTCRRDLDSDICRDLCVRFKDGGIMVRTINDEEYEEWAYIPPAATYGMPFSRVDGEGIIINGIMADVNYVDESYFFMRREGRCPMLSNLKRKEA